MTKDKLTSFVMDGKISTQSLRRKVGTGSKRHDLVVKCLIIFNMSFLETSQKRNKLGDKSMGDATVVVDANNISLSDYLVFLSAK